MTDNNLISSSISLVLLVRNEAQNVAQLLQELSPLFDEAIVVDTGSTDATVSEAELAGARVVHFPWCDDFALARNTGIDAAGSGWILTVDADERVAAGDFPVIRKAVAEGASRGYFFTQRNYTELFSHPEWRAVDGQYPDQETDLRGFIEAHQIRLFPNMPEFRYHGCIHETVRGLAESAEHLKVTVHHFGHLQKGSAAKRRNDLYSRLTREKLRRNPEDEDACFQMAIRLVEEGHPDQARPLLEKLVSHEPSDHPAITRGNLALGRILQTSGESETAIKKFELAVQQKPQWLHCWTETISALVDAGRWSEVARYLSGAQMLFPNHAQLWRFECRLLIATGEYQAAWEKARNLAEKYPHWPGAEHLADLCKELADNSNTDSSKG